MERDLPAAFLSWVKTQGYPALPTNEMEQGRLALHWLRRAADAPTVPVDDCLKTPGCCYVDGRPDDCLVPAKGSVKPTPSADPLAVREPPPGPCSDVGLRALQEEAYRNSRAHGFYDPPAAVVRAVDDALLAFPSVRNGPAARDLREQLLRGLGGRPLTESLVLMHSELSEALEEHRAGRAPGDLYFRNPARKSETWTAGDPCPESLVRALGSAPPGWPETVETTWKPEGIASELADVLIRLADTAAYHGLDLAEAVRRKHRYNQNRPFRHGGKVI